MGEGNGLRYAEGVWGGVSGGVAGGRVMRRCARIEGVSVGVDVEMRVLDVVDVSISPESGCVRSVFGDSNPESLGCGDADVTGSLLSTRCVVGVDDVV